MLLLLKSIQYLILLVLVELLGQFNCRSFTSNVEGYKLIGKAFYNSMNEKGYLPKTEEVKIPLINKTV